MRLSTRLKPSNYNLILHPIYKDLDTYTGSVDIQCVVSEKISEFSIHLDRNSVTVDKVFIKTPNNEIDLDVKSVAYDDKNFTATFSLNKEQKIDEGEVLLHFEFSGKIRKDMTGFYSSTFNSTVGNNSNQAEVYEKYPFINSKLVTTQFEALYARKAFPCFDEPSFKATFKVAISIPQELSEIITVLSNMPIEKKQDIMIDGTKRDLIHFAITPKMSTYLLAWTIGLLEKKSTQSEKRVVSVYTVPGKIESAAFSLIVAIKSLSFFENLFGIEFPLPKLDLIAIPDFNHGAMENWGLITFRELYMLVDSQTSFSLRRDIAVTVAHEVGHMWFGNLVTMEWWDGLWLNEGFATFVMNEAAAFSLNNETIREDLFAVESVQAYRDDSLSISKPIEQKINKIEDISQMFDSIRYAKGGTVLRMLSEWAGIKELGHALKAYLTKYEYNNATSIQLFKILEQELKLPVVSMMNSFVLQPGVPLMKVVLKDDKLEIQQTRFLNEDIEASQLWKLPIFIKTIDRKVTEEIITMEEKKMEKKIDHNNKGSIYVLNNKENGYYVVQYSEELLSRIIEGAEKIDDLSMLKVFRDLVLLVKYRKIKFASVLSFIDVCLKNTKHPYILSEIIGFVSYWGLFDSEKAKQYLYGYLLKNTNCKKVFDGFIHQNDNGEYEFSPLYSKEENEAGFSNKDKEFWKMFEQTALEGLSYSARAKVKGKSNDKSIMDTIIRNLENSCSVPNSLLKVIYDHHAIKDVHTLFSKYQETEVSEKKRVILRSLGLVKLADVDEVIKFAKSDKLKMQDKFIVFCSLLSRNDNKSQIAKLILKEKGYLNDLYKSSSMLGRIASSFSVFYGNEEIEVLKEMFGDNVNIEAEYNRVLEKIENNKLFSIFYKSGN